MVAMDSHAVKSFHLRSPSHPQKKPTSPTDWIFCTLEERDASKNYNNKVLGISRRGERGDTVIVNSIVKSLL